MARRSLRPELNRIRAWVRQGRTDAWIAHQLEVTVQQNQSFKREHDLDNGGQPDGLSPAAADYDDEIDLRAEDDALIAAELEAAEARRAEEEEEEEEQEPAEEEREERPKRRRGRRGGRRDRRRSTG